MIVDLVPDLVIDSVFEITPEFLRAHGFRAVILDVDSTLSPTYRDASPEMVEHLLSLTRAGFSVAFLSNNSVARVERFNAPMGFPFVAGAAKPSLRGFRVLERYLNCRPEEIMLAGDQVYTDIWTARRAGVYAVLVRPIPEPGSYLMFLNRLLEKPILRRYERLHPPKRREAEHAGAL